MNSNSFTESIVEVAAIHQPVSLSDEVLPKFYSGDPMVYIRKMA